MGQGKMRKLLRVSLLALLDFHRFLDYVYQVLKYLIEYNYGQVEYFVEACLDVPWSLDKEFKADFKVVREDDYSQQEDLISPQKQNIESIASMQASVSIPQSVFTPGSIIPITIQIDNDSDKKVGKVHLKLKQIVYYRR
jgi:hypothetical protein